MSSPRQARRRASAWAEVGPPHSGRPCRARRPDRRSRRRTTRRPARRPARGARDHAGAELGELVPGHERQAEHSAPRRSSPALESPPRMPMSVERRGSIRPSSRARRGPPWTVEARSRHARIAVDVRVERQQRERAVHGRRGPQLGQQHDRSPPSPSGVTPPSSHGARAACTASSDAGSAPGDDRRVARIDDRHFLEGRHPLARVVGRPQGQRSSRARRAAPGRRPSQARPPRHPQSRGSPTTATSTPPGPRPAAAAGTSRRRPAEARRKGVGWAVSLACLFPSVA